MSTRAVCIKVDNLRKMGYTDLEQWLLDPNNLYTGRRGRIFITDTDTKDTLPMLEVSGIILIL